MTNKVNINYDNKRETFTKDGIDISFDDALELWNKKGSSNWTQSGYLKMAQSVIPKINAYTNRPEYVKRENKD